MECEKYTKPFERRQNAMNVARRKHELHMKSREILRKASVGLHAGTLEHVSAGWKRLIEVTSRQVRTASRPLDPGPDSRRKPQEIRPSLRY